MASNARHSRASRRCSVGASALAHRALARFGRHGLRPARRPGRPRLPSAADTSARARPETSDDRRHRLPRLARPPRSTSSAKPIGIVDVIVAEDIAEFPDQNLAESLQRIPGIAITRDGGEGRADHRARPRPAVHPRPRQRHGEAEHHRRHRRRGGANREPRVRFQRLRVRAVQLDHRPQDRRAPRSTRARSAPPSTSTPAARSTISDGFIFAGSGQVGYNDLSRQSDPRVAGLISWRNRRRHVRRCSLSAAYSQRDTLELGNNTVRWAQARFDSVDGTPLLRHTGGFAANLRPYRCRARPATQAALSFHPRIPRYDEVAPRARAARPDRLAPVRSPPTATKLSARRPLFARSTETATEQWARGVSFSRSNSGQVDSRRSPGSIDDDQQPGLRHVQRCLSPHRALRFDELADRVLPDQRHARPRFRRRLPLHPARRHVRVRRPTSRSRPRSSSMTSTPRATATTITDMAASRCCTFGTSTSPIRPTSSSPRSATGPSNVDQQVHDRPAAHRVGRRPTASRSRPAPSSGGIDFELRAFTRDTAVCGNGGADLVLGTLTCSPSSLFGPTAVYGFPVTATLAELFDARQCRPACRQRPSAC